MTLTAKYGSIHTDFKVGSKKYKVPNGLAHFLEHIKFNESEDVTSHDFFYKSGGDVNAFTTFNYTTYLVFTTVNFKENLNHLIDFVYNPFFSKKLIQKEKGIIVEESNMGSDDPYALSYYKHLKNIFHEYNYKEFITGAPEEIKSITLEHVVSVYNHFYHPENMFLCITGNFNPYEMAKIIDENMDQKEFPKYIKPTIMTKKEPKEVVKAYEEIEMNVISPKVKYGVKIPRNKFKDIDDLTLRIVLSLILNVNFGSTSDLKDELTNLGLVTSLGYNVEIYGDYVLLTLAADTDYTDEVIKRIDDKLNHLDLTESVIQRKIKANIATLILDFDDIETVNNRIGDNLVFYDEIITDVMAKYKSLSQELFENIAEKIETQNKSILVIKPQQKEK
ncbi:MAG: insulinase family protein [Bacilli bacterium]|nr:insulinase family protein [Bacilli bacterium]